MTDRLARLQAVLDGTIDADTAAWLADGFARWLADDADGLSSALGLRARPYLVRVALRDWWLRQAAACYTDRPSTWAKAKKLHQAALHFESSSWLSWRREPEPPWERATRVQVCLFYACKAHRLPETARQFHTILCEADAQDGFTAPVARSA